MGINVNTVSADYDFEISAASYVGKPRDNTVMFIGRKVAHLLDKLRDAKQCLVFAEEGLAVPAELRRENCFVFTDDPRREYSLFAQRLEAERAVRDRQRKYTLTEGGYYIGENVSIGEGTVIEPLCFLGHDVKIGKNGLIKTGTKIKNTVIGDDFIAGENCVIGTSCFNMAEGLDGNKIRMPTLGGIVIGDHVDIGGQSILEVGTAGDTVLEDYVKLDVLVHVGHDSHLHRNVEITAGSIVGGFVEMGEESYVGINATLRNRIEIGDRAVIGMGAVVTRSIPADVTVVGNPARPM